MTNVMEDQKKNASKPTSSRNTLIQETTPSSDRKPRPGDFEGSFVEKQRQYKIANEQWYQNQKNSPANKRDDRIFKNAKPGGVLQSNMRKSGYIPQNEI